MTTERFHSRRFLRKLAVRCGLPGIITLLMFQLAVSAGAIAAGPVEKIPNHRSPLHRLANDRIRHDAWFQSGRNLSGSALQKLRTVRANGRLNGRRDPQPDSGCTIAAAIGRPTVIPDNSNGLNPCLNPALHAFRTRSCPVRAGPESLS